MRGRERYSPRLVVARAAPAGTAAARRCDSVVAMNSNEDREQDDKKVTQAITDAPQEEFVSPQSVPSKVEVPAKGEMRDDIPDPPRA